jgi:hypothetical protein
LLFYENNSFILIVIGGCPIELVVLIIGNYLGLAINLSSEGYGGIPDVE